MVNLARTVSALVNGSFYRAMKRQMNLVMIATTSTSTRKLILMQHATWGPFPRVSTFLRPQTHRQSKISKVVSPPTILWASNNAFYDAQRRRIKKHFFKEFSIAFYFRSSTSGKSPKPFSLSLIRRRITVRSRNLLQDFGIRSRYWPVTTFAVEALPI